MDNHSVKMMITGGILVIILLIIVKIIFKIIFGILIPAAIVAFIVYALYMMARKR